MMRNFDRLIDRKDTACVKWDLLEQVFGPIVPEDTIPLWVADMDFAAPEEVLEDLCDCVRHGILGYTFADEKLRDIAVSYIERHYRWKIQKDWIVFSPGIVPALSTLVLALTEQGDEVMTMTPVYGPFYRVVEDHDRKIVACPLKTKDMRFEIDFELMEEKISPRTKILLLCSPHNPCGRVWTREELTKLGEFALRHDLLIASDEIHADFIYSGSEMLSIASLDERFSDRSITCYAPSKTFNIAGMGASVIVIPEEELRERFHKMMRKLNLSVNALGYAGMRSAWSKGDPWLEELLVYLKGNRDFLVEAINESCPGIRCGAPEATFLLWLDCRELMKRKNLKDTDELSRFFVQEAHVALSPGTHFGDDGEGFARLNFGCPRSLLEEAVKRMSIACR